MKLPLLTLLLSFIVTLSYSQWNDNYIQLSDNITSETQNISGFDKIDISEDFEVYIRFSETAEEVEIEANENLHDLIKVIKVGTTLKISTKSYSTKNHGRKGGASEHLVAYISAKNLSEISGTEDVTIDIEGKIHADNLTINLEEDCILSASIEVQNLEVNLDEDSILKIEGSAQTMIAKANEDCVIEGSAFTVDQLTVVLIEDSTAKLTVNGDINLRAKEDSYFYYKGNGQFVRKRLSGDSEVHHW